MTETAHTPLPCPYCGGTKFQQNTKAKGYFIKKAAQRAGKDGSNHLIRCTKCGAKGPLKHSEAEALTAWNTRANSHHRLVEALGRMIEIAHAYGEYISQVPSAELERHPYLPGLEHEIDDARAALKEAGRG